MRKCLSLAMFLFGKLDQSGNVFKQVLLEVRQPISKDALYKLSERKFGKLRLLNMIMLMLSADYCYQIS
jgi:hypothetical protein